MMRKVELTLAIIGIVCSLVIVGYCLFTMYEINQTGVFQHGIQRDDPSMGFIDWIETTFLRAFYPMLAFYSIALGIAVILALPACYIMNRDKRAAGIIFLISAGVSFPTFVPPFLFLVAGLMLLIRNPPSNEKSKTVEGKQEGVFESS